MREDIEWPSRSKRRNKFKESMTEQAAFTPGSTLKRKAFDLTSEVRKAVADTQTTMLPNLKTLDITSLIPSLMKIKMIFRV